MGYTSRGQHYGLPMRAALGRNQGVTGVEHHVDSTQAPQYPVVPDIPQERFEHRTLWNTARYPPTAQPLAARVNYGSIGEVALYRLP